MRRYPYKKYLLIVGSLFLLLTLPPLFVEGLRDKTIFSCSPIFKTIMKVKTTFAGKKARLEAEKAHLVSENHLLRLEIEKMRQMIDKQALFCEVASSCGQAALGRVIYRDPATFSSTLWINVGHETNLRMKKTIIEKNSPVLYGKSVVGVIDYVGRKESRVRLITDARLKPSVRAYRVVANPLSQKEEGWYLAKGIVQGSGAPLWRRFGNRLKGVGFNYDFEDERGTKPSGMSLIEVGDLLVTTGMDGVFPQGLKVGQVTKVETFKQGDNTYSIEAKPAVGNMSELDFVFVIAKTSHEIVENTCK